MNHCVIVSISAEDFKSITNNNSFFDANGYCFDYLLQKENQDFDLVFSKAFRKDTVDNAWVLFVDEAQILFGWYENGTIYRRKQFHLPTGREYRAICKIKDAFLLSKDSRLELPISLPSFQEALVANESITKELHAFIDIIRKSANIIDLELGISQDSRSDEADSRNAKQIIKEYEETHNVFLLPSIYRKALNQSNAEPNNAKAWDYVGFSLLELARPQEALSYFEKALQLDPMYKPAACDKGRCLIRLDRIGEAIGWLNTVIEKFPDDDVRIQLSDAYLFAGFPGISYRLLKEIQSEAMKAAIAPIRKEREIAMPYLLNVNLEHSVLDPYPLFIDFGKEPLPEVYKDTSGVKRYIDPIRQKGVPITPEETVRQRVISYLQKQNGIPKETMFVEESLAHIDRELRDRVDILIGQLQSGKRKYILLVECKAPGIVLGGEPTTQLLRYNAILQAPFVLLTNGDVSHVYHFDADTGEFEALRELPTYKEMCESANIKYAGLASAQWVRPEYAALYQPDVIQKYTWEGIIGEGSPQGLAPFLLNLAFCFLDETHKIECPFVVHGCTVITDYGVIPMTTGNAGGGQFPGNYRWFGVLDRHGNRQNVYIGIFGAGAIPKDSSQVIHTEYTTLYFAIEEKGKATSRLQIRLDTCLIPDGNGYRLTHTGVRSRGKIQPLIDFIAEAVPGLLGTEERILCGWLDKTQNMYLSDSNVAKTIGSAISYLLLRSEYRVVEKGSKKAK